jgi:hypothetical protein
MKPRDLGIAFAFTIALGCSAQPDDAKIVRSVEKALAEDPALNDVAATSLAGEVTLSGVASSAADRSHAESLARAAEGVVAVRNEIQLTPAPVASPPPLGSLENMPADQGAMPNTAPANAAADDPSGS